MIIRCQECGGTHVFDLGLKVNAEEIDVSPMNGNDELNLSTLPYYIGGFLLNFSFFLHNFGILYR